MATCIRASVSRPSDFVARFGGEEFAILLPHTAKSGALTVAEIIQASVAARNIRHSCGLNNRLSVSIGVTTVIPCRDDTFAKAFDAADAALFSAKRSGRDNIVHSDYEMRKLRNMSSELEFQRGNLMH